MRWLSSVIHNTVIFINFQCLWLVKKEKKQDYESEL